ncbi:hypothetical protein Tco_1281066, partial [Tanacetum coccineum]
RLQEPDSPEAAPAPPVYVPGPEEPEHAPLSPDYVPGPEYPEYLAPSNEEVPIEDQPYAVADSPIALSPGYIVVSDPEEDPEEDSEDGPVHYPADGGDDDDDDSSNDDKEEEKAFKEEEASEEEEVEEEEEEHLALADYVVAPIVDHVPSSEETEPFEIDESAATPPSPPACRTTARIYIGPEAHVLLPPEEEEHLARCLAAPALPSSPLPRLPHPHGSPNHVRAPPGFRAAIGRLRASSPLPPPVPTTLPQPPLPSPPLPHLPSSPLPPLPDPLFIPPVETVGLGYQFTLFRYAVLHGWLYLALLQKMIESNAPLQESFIETILCLIRLILSFFSEVRKGSFLEGGVLEAVRMVQTRARGKYYNAQTYFGCGKAQEFN